MIGALLSLTPVCKATEAFQTLACRPYRHWSYVSSEHQPARPSSHSLLDTMHRSAIPYHSSNWPGSHFQLNGLLTWRGLCRNLWWYEGDGLQETRTSLAPNRMVRSGRKMITNCQQSHTSKLACDGLCDDLVSRIIDRTCRLIQNNDFVLFENCSSQAY